MCFRSDDDDEDLGGFDLLLWDVVGSGASCLTCVWVSEHISQNVQKKQLKKKKKIKSRFFFLYS